MLKPRLKCIFDNIDNNTNHVVDIGCDHAYLCIELLQQKNIKLVTNIDINSKPLLSGQKNVTSLGLGNNAEFILNDGLKQIKYDEPIDYVCISGMGADNIIQIIQNNNNNITHNYLLQPNTDINKLKLFLFNNGYDILFEKIVLENKITYEVIKVQKKQNLEFDLIDIHIGKHIKYCDDDLTKSYLLNRYHHLNKISKVTKNNFLKEEFNTIKKFIYEKKWIN